MNDHEQLMVLEPNAISHAWVRPVAHEELGVTIPGQTAVVYLRFGRKVCVQALDLAPLQAARWVPTVPTHPAHLNVWALDDQGAWRRVGNYDLPRIPEIAGEGLTQRMTIAEMEAVLRKGFSVKHRVELPNVETVALRVECDREHDVWPNHGECNGAPYMVPFAILNNLTALGQALGEAPPIPAYHRPLVKGELAPAAPAGMTVELTPWRVDFRGERFTVGFSLIRPELMHLGWDGTGSGRAGENRLHVRARSISQPFHGQSGPMLRTFQGDFNAANWTGAVEVRGNRVIYRGVTCGQGVLIDATFTVSADGLRLDLAQQADAALPVVEFEAWRVNWDCGSAMTAASAVPTLEPGRNGHVALPMFWAGDGNGVLRTELLEGEAWLQCESYNANQAVTGGLMPGRRPGLEEALVIPAGRHECAWRLSVDAYAPASEVPAALPPALRRHWGSIFSCYRPEYGGFSNNAISVNCHVNQGHPAELAAHTAKPERGPDPVDLFRFTIERALLGGGGYGFYRNLYCDSDPILLSGAGRIFQARPDKAFLKRVQPGLVAAARRVLGTLDEQGLACCRDLSGNSGSYRWSSNASDVVGFGHYDGYVNALTYRGLRNSMALLREVGETGLAARCADAAVKLRAAFAPQLLNPATGWVAGWRSRDGQLHDPAFLWINSVAIAYGLLDHDQAVKALTGLEKLRHAVGAGHAQFGLPFNLLPLDERDHMLPQPTMMGRWRSTYENYTDGSMGACFAGTYLRALSIHGLRAEAKAICADLEEGYTRGHFNSGSGGGVEFYRWDGVPTGYEGTFVASWHALYAIAIERGVIQPTDPEWWPA